MSKYLTGRDNNYNLIRVIAALTVLLSHCFTVASGHSEEEPLRNLLGMSVGDIAVDIFFFASGLLVTGSLFNSPSILSFLRARALRIYPGLLIAVSLTVIVMGPLFTDLPLRHYVFSSETYLYWVRNITLITNVAHRLPGVFDGNPWPWSVNSSLWTLPYEIAMYAVLAILGTILSRRPGRHRTRLLIAASTLFLFGLLQRLLPGLLGRPSALARLTEMFWVGVCFYLLKDRIRLSAKFGVILALMLVASTWQKSVFSLVYSLSMPYLVACAAYLPGGFLRVYNRVGDYSYGIYVYAFPVQQCLAATQPGLSVVSVFIESAFVTGCLAVLSWHFVEAPMLRLKRRRSI